MKVNLISELIKGLVKRLFIYSNPVKKRKAVNAAMVFLSVVLWTGTIQSANADVIDGSNVKWINTSIGSFAQKSPFGWVSINDKSDLILLSQDDTQMELRSSQLEEQLRFDFVNKTVSKQSASSKGYVQVGTISSTNYITAASAETLSYMAYEAGYIYSVTLRKTYHDGNLSGWLRQEDKRKVTAVPPSLQILSKTSMTYSSVDLFSEMQKGTIVVDEAVGNIRTETTHPLDYVYPVGGSNMGMLKIRGEGALCVVGTACSAMGNHSEPFCLLENGQNGVRACWMGDSLKSYSSAASVASTGVFTVKGLMICAFENPGEICTQQNQYTTRFVKTAATEWKVHTLKGQNEVSKIAYPKTRGSWTIPTSYQTLTTVEEEGKLLVNSLGRAIQLPDHMQQAAYALVSGTAVTSPPGVNNLVDIQNVQKLIPNQYITPLPIIYPDQEESPGFQVQNRTTLPVLITLSQASCIYYELIQPGETFDRDTGAVWFTLEAEIAPALAEPSLASCLVEPLVTTAAIALTIGTGGVGAVPAAMMLAAGSAAAWTLVPYLEEGGMSKEDAGWVGTGILLATGIGAGFALPSESTALSIAGTAERSAYLAERSIAMNLKSLFIVPYTATLSTSVANVTTKQIIKKVITKEITKATLKKGSREAFGAVTRADGDLDEALEGAQFQEATQAEIDEIVATFSQTDVKAGVYAGYPWPWKSKDRIKPLWVVTGGPIKHITAEGVLMYAPQETALTLTQIR